MVRLYELHIIVGYSTSKFKELHLRELKLENKQLLSFIFAWHCMALQDKNKIASDCPEKNTMLLIKAKCNNPAVILPPPPRGSGTQHVAMVHAALCEESIIRRGRGFQALGSRPNSRGGAALGTWHRRMGRHCLPCVGMVPHVYKQPQIRNWEGETPRVVWLHPSDKRFFKILCCN